jgi:cyanate permease
MDTLESLGRGYSTLGAIVSSLVGLSLVIVGNNIRVNDPQNSDKGKQMMLLGVGVGVVGVGIWYLAKTNKDIAAVEGLWLVALVGGGIIGAFKANDNVQMRM